MATIAQLLDQAKEKAEIETDSALGARIGKSRQTISQWRSATTFPEESDVLRLAHMAGNDAGPWLLQLRAERSSGDVARVWHQLAKKLGIAATIALVVAGNPLFSSVSQGAEFLPCLLCQV